MGLLFKSVTQFIEDKGKAQTVTCDFSPTNELEHVEVAIQGWDLSFGDENYDIKRFIIKITDLVYDSESQVATCSLETNVADAGAHYMTGTVTLIFIANVVSARLL